MSMGSDKLQQRIASLAHKEAWYRHQGLPDIATRLSALRAECEHELRWANLRGDGEGLLVA
ncbi:MAG TPA: hypothetical protein VK558_04430 [Patescibacteria group bacterium]|nr:hypothetical protein [Patescibacteria group bacterium]